MTPRRLTAADIACWVIKSRTPPEGLLPGWERGSARELARCVRRSYRVELMQPGQRCLLWLSGREAPGVQAIGHLVSPVTDPAELGPGEEEARVTTHLHLLTEPVPRPALLADPVFAGAEVLKMPAGSNPSYLSAPVWAALEEHLSPYDREVAGW
jgi:hypothetical protein